MSEYFVAGLHTVEFLPGKLISGLDIKFEDHGVLLGYIHWMADHNGSALPINLNYNFGMTMCHILEVLLGKKEFDSAAYNSNAHLNDILKPGLEAIAVFVNGRFRGIGHNGRFVLLGCDRILNSKGELIEFLTSQKEE